jgi:PEP-CTERM motif
MNYLRLSIVLLLASFAQQSYADSVHTFHITQVLMTMYPNDGSGDNIGFTFSGPGVLITGIAGMGCFDWCSTLGTYNPSGSPSQIFLTSFNSVKLGGVSYDPTFFNVDFFDQFGGVNPMASGIAGTDTVPLNVNFTLPTGGGWGFDFEPSTDEFGNPYYYFVSGTFYAAAPAPVPEPGTIGLILTGMVGMGATLRRNRKVRPRGAISRPFCGR